MNEIMKLMDEILAFTEERDWDQFHSPVNLAKSITIEAGELLECYQWSDEANLEHVKEELADIFNYAILIADKYNLDIKQIVLDKLAKNAQKYPVDKAYGSAKKYNEL